MYVRHNTDNDTLSLVFSLNLTEGETASMRIKDIIGDVVSVSSKEPERTQSSTSTQSRRHNG